MTSVKNSFVCLKLILKLVTFESSFNELTFWYYFFAFNLEDIDKETGRKRFGTLNKQSLANN